MVLQIIHPAMLVMKAHSNQSPTDLCMVLKTIQLAYSSAQIMIYQVNHAWFFEPFIYARSSMIKEAIHPGSDVHLQLYLLIPYQFS